MLTSWIPSTFGRVSFSQIGYANPLKERLALNFGDGARRHVLIREQRETRDSLASALRLYGVDRKVNKQSNQFEFLLAGLAEFEEFNRQNSLTGVIFINETTSPTYGAVKLSLEQHLPLFNDASEKAKTAPHWDCPFDDLQRAANHRNYEALVSTLRQNSYLSIDFCLSRFGRIDFTRARHILNPTLLNDEGAIKDSIIFGIFHAYLFAKDVSHQHTHHAPGSDSILDVYLTYERDELELSPLEPGRVYELGPPTGVEINDVNWREEVLYALHRRASALQIKTSAQELSLARGIIKYATVFSNKFGPGGLCAPTQGRFSESQFKEYIWPDYDLDSGFDIVETRIEEQRAGEDAKNEFSKALFSLFFTIITLVLSYTALLRLVQFDPSEPAGLVKSTDVDPALITFAKLFLGQFKIVGALISILYIMVHWSILWPRFKRLAIARPIRRWVLRFYLHSRATSRWMSAALVVVTAVVAALLLYFGWDLFTHFLTEISESVDVTQRRPH